MATLINCPACKTPQRLVVFYDALESWMVEEVAPFSDDELYLEVGAMIESWTQSVNRFECNECGHVFEDAEGHTIEDIEELKPLLVKEPTATAQGFDGIYHPCRR